MGYPRIALLGNCQAATLFKVLHLFAPSAEVVRFSFVDLPARFPTKEALFQEFGRFDVIFAQPFGPGLHPDLDGRVLREHFRDRFHFYPVLEFSAFHPDCVYIRDRKSSEFCRSPIGDYHSAVVFLGYSLRFTVEQTLRLFHAGVFERLGYYQFWKTSEEALFQQCQQIGFPLEGMYRSWVRRGLFMNSINHPKLFVLSDVARAMLKNSCTPALGGRAEDYLPDESLFDAVWPVYPEIANEMGLDGAYIFKAGSRSEVDNPFMTLRDFVESSCKLYRNMTSGVLECQRVEGWTNNAALVEYIRRQACG